MQNFGFFSLTAKQGQGTETKLRVNYPFFVPVTGVTWCGVANEIT